MSAKIRLYVEHPLGAGQSVPLDRGQAHYLFGVMRLGVGGQVLLFNGSDGEWLADVAQAGKRGGILTCATQTKPLQMPPDLWLLFAPIKKARTDFIVEKAAEMGAARILPVATDFTNSERIRRDRLQAHAVEAAEQCGGTYVPQVAELQKLFRVLDNWPEGRQLMFCDEAEVGNAKNLSVSVTGKFEFSGSEFSKIPGTGPTEGSVSAMGRDVDAGKWAILIGPEGGFSETERKRLAILPYSHTVSLGPRILRADTAAVAAMTLWQQALGDWA